MDEQEIKLIRPRRKNRVMDEGWIKAFLHRVPFGMIATESGGQPYIKPTSFAYDEAEGAIYFHGALKGHMLSNLEANPRASFCVAEMGRLLPADTAMDVGVEYASVVLFGRVEILKDPAQAEHGLQLMLDRYFPQRKHGVDYRPIQKQELDQTQGYRLKIESWSGKAEQARPDFPGAFTYPAID